jgi:hypothetical protein
MSDFSTAEDMFDPAPRDDGRALALMLVGGALMLVALARQSRVGQWRRGCLSARDVVTRDRLRHRVCVQAGIAPARLRAMLLGQSKASVAARFGPPRTAVVQGAMGQTAFWRADVWYYAVDAASQTAMAVTFADGTARAVEFFDAPSGQA